MRRFRKAALFTAATVLLVAIVQQPVVGAQKKNQHVVKLVDVAAVSGHADTEVSPRGFIDLTGARGRVFSEARGMLLIRFTAESRCTGSGGNCSVRVFVDGVEAAPMDEAGTVFNSTSSNGWVSGAVDRSVASVARGGHVVTVQWATVGDPSTTFKMGAWHLTVQSLKKM